MRGDSHGGDKSEGVISNKGVTSQRGGEINGSDVPWRMIS